MMYLPKNNYVVITQTIEEYHLSFADKIPGSYDLYHALQRYKNISGATMCTTWKAAQELATRWNEDYKNNGSYIFDHKEIADKL